MTKVGVIGSGVVGKALAEGFVKHGHQVMVGTREPAKLAEWAAALGSSVSIGSVADAAAFGEVAVIATAWSGTEQALRATEGKLHGKVVIDATNPLGHSAGKPELAIGHTDSGGEQVQRWLPGSKVVKAFNIINSGAMVHPDFPGGPPDMFIAGDDAEAKKTVTAICEQFGWPVTDVGGIVAARLLEPLGMLWVHIGISSGRWTNAWKLLRK